MRKPPEIPGFWWSDLTVNAPWDKEDSSDTSRVQVGTGPDDKIALYDHKTGIIHRRADSKPH